MASSTQSVLASQQGLTLLYTGKVRELYSLDNEPEQLLFVATDRVSAYDVILGTEIPSKGAILTQLSRFWFDFLRLRLPNVKTHFISLGLPKTLSAPLADDVRAVAQRSMVVRKLEMLPIESICRGYISGSAWASYSRNGTVNGRSIPAGLRESDKLPEVLWTPSTKASGPGEHDENISPARAAEILGEDVAHKVEEISKLVYQAGSEYARERGIIIADTKFEFALDRAVNPPEVVLCDEVLTPDSSRFWSVETYEPGRAQPSMDKQPLRDWLSANGLMGKKDVTLPDDVVATTAQIYRDAYLAITGKEFTERG